MTSSPAPKSGGKSVTHRRRSRRGPRASAPAVPGAPAADTRFLPPTPEQVGWAAALCFQDTHSDEQIARQVGIVRRTLARWKKRSDFAAAIAALQVWQDISRGASS